ncbi:uncharacterized protein RJT21DRAFT_123288 [Scheffersomyces amazonensis]|uniref:uncharacterized protein n=1 Tax=Scheffersomyces amazonensis TaxID=1078765 RepID=UPI00315C50EA
MDNWTVLDQLRILITSSKIINNSNHYSIVNSSNSNYNSSNNILNHLINYWHSLSIRKQRSIILQTSIVFGVLYYILSPTLAPSPKMFSKRPDKYTTGFINLRNDCFANSSIQAYSALPGLTDYLNKFIKNFQLFNRFIIDNKIDINLVIKDKQSISKPNHQSAKFKSSNSKFSIPLHYALAEIIKKLQETQLTSRTISVWTFLHCLEGIFNAKISRSQHDAHELTQLINETLENENIKIMKLLTYVIKNLHKYTETSTPSPSQYDSLQSIVIPEFPFGGLILSQLKCSKCEGFSTPIFTPFTMITLHTPEKISTELSTLLDESENEIIDGYNCLKCRVSNIVANEKLLNRKSKDEQEEKYLHDITKIYNENFKALCINDDLEKGLESYINSYSTKSLNGFEISQITSKVIRKTQILKPPRILGIHLSRSSFNGVNITRNPCHVSYKDNLTLSIGPEYHEKLKEFQESINSNEEIEPADVKSTNVLTTDVNDMEDEYVQREDVDEKGPDEEAEDVVDDGDVENDSTTDGVSADDDDDDDIDEDVSNTSSASSRNTSVSNPPSISTQTTAPNSSSTNNGVGANKNSSRTINNAPISADQEYDLKEHFKKFKFNDNDIYKYTLKAVIRHQGSHTQGHYECYKRKPLFVKDKEGHIFKLSREIDIEDDQELESTDFKTSESGDSVITEKSDTTSMTGSTSMKRRLSNIMGRRPSVIYQANTEESNIEEIVHSGIATPAEFLVNDLDATTTDYFQTQLTEDDFKKKHGSHSSSKVKMKKIPSVIKSPYWRISDATVVEVSKSQVLVETSSVYMIYYERVERKQVKSRNHRHA